MMLTSPGLTQGLIPLPEDEVPPEEGLNGLVRPNVLVQSVTRKLLMVLYDHDSENDPGLSPRYLTNAFRHR